ncbi:phosphotransferase enzyme family protein [Streptomyces hydrogenans]|uniref:phosphotransferase enzyme family protein n=1 Tax=Streptomyces hydrogenans TaxID=1873719 RepID=UPI0035E3B97B
MTPLSAFETEIARVTLLLARDFGIVAVSVEQGPSGTATRNYLAAEADGTRWFVKTYPPGSVLKSVEEAARLSEYARLCRVPVAAARATDEGRLTASYQGLVMTVTRYVPDAVTADGQLTGRRWEAVGEAVGRLHRGFARHRFGPPRTGPVDKALDLARAAVRLKTLVSRYAATPQVTAFGRWTAETAREKLARLPEAERLLAGVPRAMVSQLVHGDLSGPNVLLRGEGVAAVVDFHPPVRRGAVWELGRLALDPRTVLAQPDWPEGLGRLTAAYHALHPVVPVQELVNVARVTAAVLLMSVYPLDEVLDSPGPADASLEQYARDRYEAAAVLCDRLNEVEEVLRDHLA